MDMPFKSPEDLQRQAINAALEQRWKEALKLNNALLKRNPENVDTLNRLGRTCFELNELKESKKYYTLALKYDPYNPIAQKNLKILGIVKGRRIKQKRSNGNGKKISPALFLQEPGKTKVVSLIKLAEPQKISGLFCGMEVVLTIKNKKLQVVDEDGTYLGTLPDDVAFKLQRLLKGGNKYLALVKAVKVNGLSILIREVKRSARFKTQPSFLETSNTVSKNSVNIPQRQPMEPVEEEE